MDGIFSSLQFRWCLVITFIDCFFDTSTTLKLTHFPAFAIRPFPSKNYLQCSIKICKCTLSSVVSTRSSAKAKQHNNLPLTSIPTFSFCISSDSSSTIKLSKNGNKGQPCFTLALILSFWLLCLLLLFLFKHPHKSPLLSLSPDLESPFFLSPFQCCYDIPYRMPSLSLGILCCIFFIFFFAA